jgi:hypothetical protein
MNGVVHTYQYLHPSRVTEGARPKLSLATSDPSGRKHPYFFEGRVLQPRLTANLLAAVHLVVGSKFFTPANTVQKLILLADPVVTSGGGLLRFEGFSSCCSTYVRVDLLPAAYEGDIVGKGTTNVDFNAPMRSALARIRDDAGLEFCVGQDDVRLRSSGIEVTERKVELPTRWIRGMLEVQSYQASMRKCFTVSAVEAMRFFRSLPKASTSRTPLWVAKASQGLYVTTREVAGGVRVTEVTRLRVLQALLPKAKELIVYADDKGQSSAWVLDFVAVRLTLVLSAEVWRGFSGEGQALRALMRSDRAEVSAAFSQVRATLQWQAALDPEVLAPALNLDPGVFSDTLRVLGASGLVGFDVFDGRYFHRVLPYDMSMQENLQPRLVDARALVESGAVNVIKPSPFEATVASNGTEHRIREVEGELRCTCPWFAKYQGGRGPCKHILAAAAVRA